MAERCHCGACVCVFVIGPVMAEHCQCGVSVCDCNIIYDPLWLDIVNVGFVCVRVI